MSWDKTDLSFKTLINKRETDNAKLYLNEKGDFTINVHAEEIWFDAIPSTPPTFTSSVVRVFPTSSPITLVQDSSVGGGMAYFASTNTDPITSQTDETSRLKDFISDKFGRGYAAHVYDSSGNLLSVADPSGYFFNYQTGILTFSSASTQFANVANSGPFKVAVYQYVGRKGIGNATVSSIGGINGIVTDQVAGAPITAVGNLLLDTAYSPTWTGAHTFQGAITSTNNLTFKPSVGNYGLRLANISTLPTPIAENTGGLVWDTSNGGTAKISNGSAWLVIAATAPGTVNVTGSGAANTIPVWENTTGLLGNSIMTQPDASTIAINGRITALTKSFTIPHPTKPLYDLVYGSLEGPEHGAYHRGRARGKGVVRVELPEYWAALVGSDYTVQLTSYCSHSVRVLVQDTNSFTVTRCGFLLFRNTTIEFSFQVIGSRRDAPLITEQPRAGI